MPSELFRVPYINYEKELEQFCVFECVCENKCIFEWVHAYKGLFAPLNTWRGKKKKGLIY